MKRVGRTSVPWLLALALLAGAPLGCTSDHDKMLGHLSRADEYLKEGQQKEALLELRSALKLEPANAGTNFRIAEVLDRMQQFGDAAFFYGEAYRLDPSMSDAALAQAKILSFSETDRAEKLVQEVLEREPDNARAQVVRSHLALLRKDTPAALTAALTAVELDPKSSEAFHQLGQVHQARIVEAREVATQAPSDEIFEAAIAAFARAAELGTPYQAASAMRQRARVLATWPGHEAQAEAAFRELVTSVADSEDARLREEAAQAALVYARRTGNQELRRWSIERLLEVDPASIEAWTELANLAQAEDGGGEAVFRRLIEQRPEDARAHTALARFLVQQGRVDDAISHLEGVVDRTDDPVTVLGFLVDVSYQQGRNEAAAQLVDRLEREHPDATRTALARAQRQIAEGQIAEAADGLRKLTGRVESPGAWQLLALAEYRRGRMSEATAAIERAIALAEDPEPEALRLQAYIQYVTRDWDGLLRTNQALAQLEGRIPLRMQLMSAEGLLATGRPALAMSVLEPELAKDEPSQDAVLLFVRYRGAAQPERARRLLEAALARSPDDTDLLTALAERDLAEGRREEALGRLDAILAGDLPPGQVGALHALRARVKLELGRLEEAEADALAAFRAAPGDIQNANLLIGIYAEQGRLDQAIASLEEARDVGALGPAGLELLARLYGQAGRDDQAIALLEELLQQDGRRVGAKNDLAFLLAKRGRDLDRALDLAREARAALGGNPGVADTLGYVYYRKELYQPAVEQFRTAIEEAKRAGQVGAASATYHYHLGLALRGLERRQEAMEAFNAALSLDPDLADAKEALAELKAAEAGTGPGASSPS